MRATRLDRVVAVVERVTGYFDRLVRLFCLVLLCSMTGVVLLQVFCRYVLNSALLWPEELARYILVWITFVGSGVALRQGEHVGVIAVLRRFPEMGRLWCTLGIKTVILLFLLLFIRYGWHAMMVSAKNSSPALGISLLWPRLALPVGGGIMLVNTIYLLLKDIQRL